MSYDIYLELPTCEHCGRGDDGKDFNITWNYAQHYYKHLDKETGIRWLYGKKGSETTERMLSAIEALDDDVDTDGWLPTEGNARAALIFLYEAAKEYPDGVWSGD